MRWFHELINWRKAKVFYLHRHSSLLVRYSHKGNSTTLSGFAKEPAVWCKKNLKKAYGVQFSLQEYPDKGVFIVWFMSDEDAVLFKMFWL